MIARSTLGRPSGWLQNLVLYLSFGECGSLPHVANVGWTRSYGCATCPARRSDSTCDADVWSCTRNTNAMKHANTCWTIKCRMSLRWSTSQRAYDMHIGFDTCALTFFNDRRRRQFIHQSHHHVVITFLYHQISSASLFNTLYWPFITCYLLHNKCTKVLPKYAIL